MFQPKKKAARKRRQAPEKAGVPTLGGTVKCILIAFPVTVGVGLLLLFAAAALLLQTNDPDRYHTAVALTLLYLTAAIGGGIATALCRRRFPLLCGLGEAVLLILLITVLVLCLPTTWQNGTPLGISLLLRVLLLPASLIGAYTVSRQGQRRRR